MDEAEYCDRIGLIYRGELISLGTPDELKRTHMKETVLEIMCNSPQDKILEAENLPEVKEAAIFGHGLHVILNDSSEDTMKSAMQKIEGLFVNDAEFSQKKIISSLENVFVSLIEAKDRERSPVEEVRR